MNAGTLKDRCERENIRLELIENADHSLNIVSDDIADINVNIDILKKIVGLY